MKELEEGAQLAAARNEKNKKGKGQSGIDNPLHRIDLSTCTNTNCLDAVVSTMRKRSGKFDCFLENTMATFFDGCRAFLASNNVAIMGDDSTCDLGTADVNANVVNNVLLFFGVSLTLSRLPRSQRTAYFVWCNGGRSNGRMRFRQPSAVVGKRDCEWSSRRYALDCIFQCDSLPEQVFHSQRQLGDFVLFVMFAV